MCVRLPSVIQAVMLKIVFSYGRHYIVGMRRISLKQRFECRFDPILNCKQCANFIKSMFMANGFFCLSHNFDKLLFCHGKQANCHTQTLHIRIWFLQFPHFLLSVSVVRVFLMRFNLFYDMEYKLSWHSCRFIWTGTTENLLICRVEKKSHIAHFAGCENGVAVGVSH